jgi:pyruvate formate lyase activating enzyme
MVAGGLEKFSLIDYPDHPSAIVFTQGCNFACRFCHNPELVDPSRFVEPLPLDRILAFLEKRKTQLKGVVVTGGEPTIHADIENFLHELKGMGYSVKLDTNGSRPEIMESLLDRGLVDFIAMDIKAPIPLYPRITGCAVNTADIERSIRSIISRNIPHEFRTTILEQILTLEDVREIGKLIKGCSRYVLQPFIPTKAIDETLLALPRTSEKRLLEFRDALADMGVPCRIR